MSIQITDPQTYSIQEASHLTGLSSSTLRYYESIGIIQPIRRDASSKHRTYSDDDLNILTSIACLSATGMSLKNMREYLRYRDKGAAGAPAEIGLLEVQEKLLSEEARLLKVRQQYVSLKISYWRAVESGNQVEAGRIADRSRKLIKDLQSSKTRRDK
ncbi:MAG TPA: MerR family transcriptional regulator [Candidatus Saccharimonadaceae bacterium]|nr:MerR family transcriptional regulator [Candidatus Saccharimonadaceae bacterium]